MAIEHCNQSLILCGFHGLAKHNQSQIWDVELKKLNCSYQVFFFYLNRGLLYNLTRQGEILLENLILDELEIYLGGESNP